MPTTQAQIAMEKSMFDLLPPLTNVVTLPRDATLEQIKAITDRDGAVIVEDLIPQHLLKSLNDDVDRTLEECGASQIVSIDPEADKYTKRLAGIAARSDAGAEIISLDRIVGWAEQCLDNENYDIQLGSAQVLEVWPGAKAQLIHQDGGYMPMFLRGPNKPELVASCMVALTDFTAENGATRVIPQTQGLDIDWLQITEIPETVPAVMKAGSAMFFTGKVAHGAGSNISDKPRRGMTIAFYAGYLRPEEAHSLMISRERAQQLPLRTQQLLGFRSYYARATPDTDKFAMAWQYEIGEASQYLEKGTVA